MKITVLQNLKQKFYALGDYMREYRRLGRECRQLHDEYTNNVATVTANLGNYWAADVQGASRPTTCVHAGYTWIRNLNDSCNVEPVFFVSYCKHFGHEIGNGACAETGCACFARNQECVRAWDKYVAARAARRAFLQGAKTHTK